MSCCHCYCYCFFMRKQKKNLKTTPIVASTATTAHNGAKTTLKFPAFDGIATAIVVVNAASDVDTPTFPQPQ